MASSFEVLASSYVRIASNSSWASTSSEYRSISSSTAVRLPLSSTTNCSRLVLIAVIITEHEALLGAKCNGQDISLLKELSSLWRRFYKYVARTERRTCASFIIAPTPSDPTSPDSLLLHKYSDRNPLTHSPVRRTGGRRRRA